MKITTFKTNFISPKNNSPQHSASCHFVLLTLLFVLSTSCFAAEWASIYHSLLAFDERSGIPDANRPGYVKPIATNLGTVLNSNWFSSASVPQNFTFEAGLPITLVPITNADREYAGGAPTIMGDKKAEWGETNPNISCTTAPGCHTVNGNKNLHNLGVFTYPYLQVAGSFYHARLVLRGMLLPAISELRSFNLFGFGLQYSFGHLFAYRLPRALQGFDISLAFGMNFSGIGYRPDDYKGSLDLDFTTTHFMLLAGYKPIRAVEIILGLGYETSNMKSGGHLISEAEGSYGAEIYPTLEVSGKNGFRLSLSASFAIGSSFNPVIGADFGTKTSFTTNVLYFKQTFGKEPTPQEIAAKKAKAAESQTASNQKQATDSSDVNDAIEANE